MKEDLEKYHWLVTSAADEENGAERFFVEDWDGRLWAMRNAEAVGCAVGDMVNEIIEEDFKCNDEAPENGIRYMVNLEVKKL